MKIIIHEANGLQIGQRREDGYINATVLSKAHYKATNQRRDTSHWLALERTKQSIKHLSRLTEISVDQLVIKVRTGKNKYRGTYIHPSLAVRFGIWLSDDFGYMVEKWVSQWMMTGQNPIAPDSTPTDLLAEINRLENLIISIRSQSRIFHTGSHQPADAALFKTLHTISHNQLGVINSAIERLQKLKQIAETNSELAIKPDSNQESATQSITETSSSQTKSHYQPKTSVIKDLTAANFIANIPVVTAKEATVRFTIDLPESIHRKLSIYAARTGQSKADILRMLLDDALEDINE